MMVVIGIDRTAANHGDYSGTVKLTYDEIVMIGNALYKKTGSGESYQEKRYSELYNSWRGFCDMTCYGKICPNCGADMRGEA